MRRHFAAAEASQQVCGGSDGLVEIGICQRRKQAIEVNGNVGRFGTNAGKVGIPPVPPSAHDTLAGRSEVDAGLATPRRNGKVADRLRARALSHEADGRRAGSKTRRGVMTVASSDAHISRHKPE